ncbi:unnamed protein product [Chironomus riparius]|uniref:Peptidase S1 domain-containing protein n=1 Tax=Chironomus riparius TaxID=315576 RepID=A0A9N9WUV6_9DIPT|nr:unnamed protein product [Chironomus riparius]
MKYLILLFGLQFFIGVTKSDFTSWDANTYVPNVCVCVPVGKCSYAGEAPETDGSGIIEARIATLGENPKDNLGTNETLCQPVSTGIPLVASDMQSCEDGLELCCPSIGYSCGIRYPPMEGSPVPINEQAPYGAYPYQAVILSSYNLYIASGVLIDQYHVLTVAHKVYNLSSGVKVRLGDWDAASPSEPLDAIERNVTIHIHPGFNLKNLRNDIAILRLNSLVPLGQYPTIGTVCLPRKDACTGDGGAPLSCFVGDRFYLQGLVAWGIKCGTSNIPGVYVNINSYVPWIQDMTKRLSNQKELTTTKKSNPIEKTTTVTVRKRVTTTKKPPTTTTTIKTTPKKPTTTKKPQSTTTTTITTMKTTTPKPKPTTTTTSKPKTTSTTMTKPRATTTTTKPRTTTTTSTTAKLTTTTTTKPKTTSTTTTKQTLTTTTTTEPKTTSTTSINTATRRSTRRGSRKSSTRRTTKRTESTESSFLSM